MDHAAIRQRMTETRKDLTPDLQRRYSQQLMSFLQPHLKQDHDHFAVYLSVRGEVDLQPVIEWLWSQEKHLYLPVVEDNHYLSFKAYTPETVLTPNRFNILEPPTDALTIDPAMLDVALVPTVAFNPFKGRIGTGGGYYDRTFSFKHHHHRPHLIGIAYDFQLAKFEPEAWDVSMDTIVTNAGVLA